MGTCLLSPETTERKPFTCMNARLAKAQMMHRHPTTTFYLRITPSFILLVSTFVFPPSFSMVPPNNYVNQRLVKDFVGARLEAEETLRKQRAAALLDRVVDSPEATLDASHRKSLPLDETISGRRPQDQGLLEHHQRPDSSSGSEQHALRPGPAEGSSPASDARHHVVSSAVTPSPCAGDETPRNGAAAHDLCNEGAPRTDGEQRLFGAAPVALTALRQRERALASPVAVLDDRMARARPTGLLATVRPASISVSTLVSHSAPVPAADPTCFDRGSDEDVVHDTAARAVVFGAELRGNAVAASNAAAVAATHGRYRYGQRRRRMSVPLLASLAGGDEDAGALGSGARAREMRRPWTTPHGEGEAEAIMREEGEEDSSGGGVTVRPFRWGGDSIGQRIRLLVKLGLVLLRW